MKLLYIGDYYTDKEKIITSGVSKKIRAQINSLQKRNFHIDNIEIKGNTIYLKTNNNYEEVGVFYPSFYKSWRKMYQKLNEYNSYYDYIYIRHNYIGYNFIKYLKKQRKKGAKVILEFPTISKRPEKGSNIKNKISFYIKKILNNLLRGNIDLIVTFSDDNKIYGIQTAKIENCIDTEDVPIISKTNLQDNNKIILIGVASLTPSHGYDRIIEGIREYYKNSNYKYEVYFNIVGDGRIRKELEEKVEKYKLGKYIKFYGKMGGKKLDDLFNKSDFAIGAMATYRKGAKKCSELKIREYCARGIPFIYSAIEPYLENKNEFCMKVNNDNSNVNIESIVDFCLKFDYVNTPQKMREFAIENFNWDKQFEKVFSKIEVKK